MGKKKKFFWSIVILLTLLRIGLMLKLPFYAIGNAKYDDFLLLDYAKSIANGAWLGDYGRLTLVKGISFSLFILLCKYLFMPYSLGLVLFYIGAALVFCIAIKYIIKKKEILAICFLFLIYCPTGFSLRLAQKIYRMAIIYPSVLLTVACLIGLYLRKDKNVKDQMIWLIGSGLSFSFFWFIREDSIWLAPFFFGALIITIIYYLLFLKVKIKEKIIRCLVMIIPIAIFILTNTAICVTNYHYYGVYTTNDRTDTEFADLVGNMLQIKAPKVADDIWISRETMEKLMTVSPTLASIEDTVLYYYDAWSGERGQLNGDIFTWALRDAVSACGYYDTAVHAKEFYTKVNNEVEEAFKNGSLEKQEAIYFTSQSKGVQINELPKYIKNTISNLFKLATYKYSNAELITYADGVDMDTRIMESITGVQAMYRTRYSYSFSGYLFAKNNDDILQAEIIDENKNIVEAITFRSNDDTKNKYPNYENSKKANFNINFEDLKKNNYTINIYINGELVDNTSIESNETENYILNIEKNQCIEDQDPLIKESASVIKISNSIIKAYKITSYVLIFLSAISYIYLFVIGTKKLIKNKDSLIFELCIILAGLLLCKCILGFGVTVFSGFLPFDDYYSAGVYPLIQIFEFISIFIAIKEIKKNINLYN